MKKALTITLILILSVVTIYFVVNNLLPKEITNVFKSKEVSFTANEVIDKTINHELWLKSADLYTEEDHFVIKYKNHKKKIYLIDNYYEVSLDKKDKYYEEFIKLTGALISGTQELYDNDNYQSTYLKATEGIITAMGLNIIFNDNLTKINANFDDILPRYKVLNTYEENEFIKLDSKYYDISVGDLLISNIDYGYSKEINWFTICFEISNPKLKETTLIIEMYDKNKKLLDSHEIKPETSLISGICTEFEDIKFNYLDIHSIKIYQS